MTARKMPMGRLAQIRDHTNTNTDYTYDKRGGGTRKCWAFTRGRAA